MKTISKIALALALVAGQAGVALAQSNGSAATHGAVQVEGQAAKAVVVGPMTIHAFSEFKGYEAWEAVALSQVPGEIKVIAANPTMMAAYKKGLPASGKIFPDGSKVVKIDWLRKPNPASPYAVDVPGELKTQANAVIAQMSANAQPVARGGQPEDIANAVAYLASEESSFMTGTHMLVDGGLTIGQRHAWDKETPGMFDALLAMEEAAKAGAAG